MLRATSSKEWLSAVLNDFDAFLIDHAANERKASANALSFVVHYSDRPVLVDIMLDIAREELEHFHQVYQLMKDRGLQLGRDEKDVYVNKLLKMTRNDREGRMIDRLVLGSVIEARGCERFGLIASALKDNEIGAFYHELAKSEATHREDFLKVARTVTDSEKVDAALDLWLDREAKVLEELPIASRLH
jgi:tRNA 2-(methylsulfanyl)-N6-isopentenyladenosine37 hydroxylase